MISLLLTLVSVAQLVAVSEQACPSGTIQVGGSEGQSWCIRHYSAMKFCDAVKTCHSNGEEMISKPVFDAMKADANISGSLEWWVGLVDALNERGTSESGWVWMKDGQVTTGAEGYFNSGEPNDQYLQDCVNVHTSDKQLRDAECTETHQFYCYFDPTTGAVPKAVNRFEKTEIKVRQQPDPGCWIRQSNVPHLVACTLACFGAQFGDCVGFYWNAVRQECVILPYFDATLPVSDSAWSASYMEMMQWTKYLITN